MTQNHWLAVLGLVFRVPVYLALVWLVWTIGSDDISNVPIGQLTLSRIFWVFFVGAIMGGLIWLLFNPSGDQAIRRSWGGLAILAVIALALFFYVATTR